MVEILLFIIFLCLFSGLVYFTLMLLGWDVGAPKSDTLAKIIRWKKSERDFWKLPPFHQILMAVSTIMIMPMEKETKLNEDLARANLDYTAQEYVARAVLSTFVGVAFTLVAWSINSPLFMALGVILSVYLYIVNMGEVKDELKKKNTIIESEIPNFIRSIVAGLETEKDLIKVIERYTNVASPTMRSELIVLLTEMRSSSVPMALSRFDRRVNLPDVSRLCAALIGQERGIDETPVLNFLAQDMAAMHHELIQRELDKRPSKMKRAILPAALVLVLMMFYIMVMAVVSSVNTLT